MPIEEQLINNNGSSSERIADEPPRDDDRERVVDHVSTSTTKYLAAAQTHINVGAE
jgi:hypothetical protein